MYGEYKMVLSVLSLTLFMNNAVGKSLPMPSYIEACSRNEPDLAACILKTGKLTIPKIINGDRKYRIPVLDPLKIAKLNVNEGILGLNFTATDIVMTGLKDSELVGVTWDGEKKTGSYIVTIPRIEVAAQYAINGRMLILPIVGEGLANITLMNVTTNYIYNWDIVANKHGEVHLLPSDSLLTYNTTRQYVYLDNLFNGNKLLGEQMNRFMDENWEDMVKELGPVMGEAVGEVMRQIQSNVFELVNYENAFPDKPV